MIKLFRTFNPLNVLWLAIFMIVLRLGFIYHIPERSEFPLADLYKNLLIPDAYQFFLPPAFNLFLASILLFAQALLINYLINQYNLLSRSTFLPSLMFITVGSLFSPFLMLSPPLICNFLLIWMLFKLFSFYKSTNSQSIAYDLGMIVAVGTLIYLPFIYMFLGIWIALLIFRPFNWREWVAGLIGYLTIFFFLAVLYYMNDRLGQLYTIWLPLATKFTLKIHINSYNYLVLIPVLVILLLCFFTIQKNFFKSYVQIRKTFQLLFFIFLIAALSFYVRSDFYLSHFLLCTASLAIFFAYYFLHATKRWFYESLFFLLVFSIIYFQFNTF